MKTIRVFNKEVLINAAKQAAKLGLNRQLDIKALEALDEDLIFPVVFSMLHEHAAGKAVEPHIRAGIAISETTVVYLDVLMPVYRALPEMEIPESVLS